MSDGHIPRPSLYPPTCGDAPFPPRMPDPYDRYPVYPPPMPDDRFAHSFRYPPFEGQPPNSEFTPGSEDPWNTVPYPPPPLEQPYLLHPHSESFSTREQWIPTPDFRHSNSERVVLPHGRNLYEESQPLGHLNSHGRSHESPHRGHHYPSHEESHGYEHRHSPGRNHGNPHRGHHHEETHGFEHLHLHDRNNESPHRGHRHEVSNGFEHLHSHGRDHESPHRSDHHSFHEKSHESPRRSHHYPPHGKSHGYEHLDSHGRSHESPYESPQRRQQDPSRLHPTPSYGSHHGEGSIGPDRSKSLHGSANGPVVKIFCKAKPEFNLALRHDGVVLVPADKHDESQQWIWDQSWSTRVKDVTGQPAFALVNKASNEALKHAKEAFQQVRTAYYPPASIDESILWTQSEDMGEGYRTIRKVNEITLNLDALKGDKKSGGVREGTPAILFKWKKQENQLWKIIPL